MSWLIASNRPRRAAADPGHHVDQHVARPTRAPNCARATSSSRTAVSDQAEPAAQQQVHGEPAPSTVTASPTQYVYATSSVGSMPDKPGSDMPVPPPIDWNR